MTAEGLLCLQFLGSNRNDVRMRNGADWLLKELPEQQQKRTSYYWYYATYALFQYGGDHWKQWQKKLETAVVKNQHRDGSKKNLVGSWDPIGAWGEDGGRVYSTAILTLTLEAYYRYSRLVR